MGLKMEHIGTLTSVSGSKRRNQRQCLPVVAKLEDRGLLSAVGAGVAAEVASSLERAALNVSAQIAEVHSVSGPLARRSALVATRDAEVIHFPGGSVTINRTGTHVIFPGGSVHASRHGAIVTFPGGYVVSRFGHTVVRFPGGIINI